MKKTIMAVSILLFFATSVFAIDAMPLPNGTGPNFEQRKTEIINRIDQRITRNQEEKTCVQSAKSHDDLKACRDKFKTEVQKQRHNIIEKKR